MIALPAFSGPANDFSCSDVVFFSQSKPIIIGFHSLQKSLHSLESVHNQKLKNISVLEIYLHFEFCGVRNLHAQTDYTEAIALVQLKA